MGTVFAAGFLGSTGWLGVQAAQVPVLINKITIVGDKLTDLVDVLDNMSKMNEVARDERHELKFRINALEKECEQQKRKIK